MKQPKFSLWLIFNIILPLMPVFIKFAIHFFGNSDRIFVEVLDSSELLYFSFIICAVFLYEMICKESKTGIEYIMVHGALLVIFLDIVLLMLIYGKQDSSPRIKVYSIIISILVPIVSGTHKYKEYKQEVTL